MLHPTYLYYMKFIFLCFMNSITSQTSFLSYVENALIIQKFLDSFVCLILNTILGVVLPE
jgi:hypothetical protein